MMLKDKDMAGDCLDMLKHGCMEKTKAASECSNNQLRSTLIQMRDTCEQTQQQFSQTVTQKGWYLPSNSADQNEISRVKSYYQSGGNTAGTGTGSFTANTINDRML